MLTQIATFMLRYLDVLVGEARRMRIARISRGDDPRFLWQVRGFAAGIGALFLRAFERGERVYLAMVSRGYDGRMPAAWHASGAATGAQWAAAATVPVGGRGHRRHGGAALMGAMDSLTVAGLEFAYPDGQVALRGVDLPWRAASGWRCSGPTAPARPRSCCTSTAS